MYLQAKQMYLLPLSVGGAFVVGGCLVVGFGVVGRKVVVVGAGVGAERQNENIITQGRPFFQI